MHKAKLKSYWLKGVFRTTKTQHYAKDRANCHLLYTYLNIIGIAKWAMGFS
jgi:hypothetical protein